MATQARDPSPHLILRGTLAGIGRGQLLVLSDRVAARRHNCEVYEKALGSLPGVEFMP